MGVKKKKVDGHLAANFFLPIEWKNLPLVPDSSFSCRIYPKIAVPGTSCDFDEATMLTGSAAFDLAPRSVFSFRNACQPNLQGLASRKYSVAILGAGHGGLALAGYLAQHGHQVTLWNRTFARLGPVAQRGGIYLTTAQTSVQVPVARATSVMSAALADVRLVLVAVPACAHGDIGRACAPHLRDGQTVLLVPGRTGGALEFQRTLGPGFSLGKPIPFPSPRAAPVRRRHSFTGPRPKCWPPPCPPVELRNCWPSAVPCCPC